MKTYEEFWYRVGCIFTLGFWWMVKIVIQKAMEDAKNG